MRSEYSTAGKTGEVCSVQTDAGLGYFGPSTASSSGQTITRGSALAAVTISPMVTTGTTIADDNAAIGAELVAQIHAGNLPAPTYDAQGYPNTLYVVFFPSNCSISIQNFGSCTAFGGYHYSGPYTASPTCKSQYIPYAVIPDCGGRIPSGAVSHELAEAVTDTDVGPTEPSMLLGARASGSFGGSSSGSSGYPSSDGSAGDDGGFGDTGGSASSGCSCEAAGPHDVTDLGALAMLAGGAATLARRRRNMRR
jgi:MYXO-CTERM domain-containing protein